MSYSLRSGTACTVCRLLPLVLLLFVSSCKRGVEKQRTELSVEAEKTLARVKKLYLIGTKEGDTYLDSAYATFENPNTKELFEKYRIKADRQLNAEHQPAKASLLTDSMFQVLEGKENLYQKEYVTATFIRGDILVAENRFDEAFKYYYDARQYAVKNLEKCNTYEFTYRLGLLKFKQERYREAIPYVKKTFEESSECLRTDGSPYMAFYRQSYLNTLALCYEKTGQLKQAMACHQKALELLQLPAMQANGENAVQRAKGVTYGNLGGIYAKLGNFALAEKYLKLSIAINDRPGFEVHDAQTAKLKLANTYMQLSRYKDAERLLGELQHALDHKEKAGQMPVVNELSLYELQWQYADSLKLQKQAFAYMQRYYHLRDSLDEVSRSLKTTDMEAAFDSHEQQHQLELLDKDNEVKQGYLIAFVLFSVMALWVLWLVWRNRKRLQQLNAEITVQNTNMLTALKALEQSQEENTRMMKIVAHDLRSPIAATISITGLLKKAQLKPEDLEMVELLETSSQQSLEMISDLLNINTEAADLAKEPVELHQLLRYSVKMTRFKAAEKQQQISLKLVDVTIYANREKIWRVVSNLIVNAIKFSKPESTIEVGLKRDNDWVLIYVKDMGIGIPPELKEKIFEMFTDAKRKGTAGEDSFGLGLAISKQIVAAHGGHIWVESEVGKGSTFWIRLPLNG